MYLDSLIKAECCGCGACVQACAINCIKMQKDDEGFLYPVIEKEKCVNCGKCKTVCPVDKVSERTLTTAWAGIHKNKETAEKSASGGAFFAIAEKLINKGYIFFGACWDENNNVIIDSADTLEGCERFRKSKYLQADTNGCFKRVKEFLDSAKKVVFSGLPCQVAALKTFLGIEYDNLLCVDIICHGAPNQEMFDCEISYLENKYSDKVLTYEFKNKRKINGEINTRSCCITFESGKEILCAIDDDPFLKAYYTRLIYRESCSKCPFANEKRFGDITLGDAWNAEKIYDDLNPVEGVSLVLTSTKKGEEVIKLLDNMELRPLDTDWAVASNEQLHKPAPPHHKRKKFFKIRKTKGFAESVKICAKMKLSLKIKVTYLKCGSKIKRFLKRMCSRCLKIKLCL